MGCGCGERSACWRGHLSNYRSVREEHVANLKLNLAEFQKKIMFLLIFNLELKESNSLSIYTVKNWATMGPNVTLDNTF